MKRNGKRIVVKIGSRLLTSNQGGVNHEMISSLARQISKLKKRGYEVMLVSSGAIAAGMGVLGKTKRPQGLADLQVCASIGQPVLMGAYQEVFAQFGLCSAQILVTSWDLDSRSLYKNARATVEALLGLGNCVPIFNENDALSFEEIAMLNRFGDNDMLSAQVALLAEASSLIILTSVDGLRTNSKGGRLIYEVNKIDKRIESYAGGAESELSVGGMASKLNTAKLMMKEGIPMHIVDGRINGIIGDVLKGHKVGTLFVTKTSGNRKKVNAK
ncbi:MAG: glutamate 5-kinase [Verrucomicrobiota bacterium]